MELPPLPGVVQVSVTDLSPACAVRLVGAGGAVEVTVAVGLALSSLDSVLSPCAFTGAYLVGVSGAVGSIWDGVAVGVGLTFGTVGDVHPVAEQTRFYLFLVLVFGDGTATVAPTWSRLVLPICRRPAP